MREETKQALSQTYRDFRLPLYREIPDVGLYLEQVTKFIGEALGPLGCEVLTGSMVSNYVKKGLIRSPEKKQYRRDQIAQLMFMPCIQADFAIAVILDETERGCGGFGSTGKL